MSAQPFFDELQEWKAELNLLRKIVLQHNLEETIKWMHPCYTLNDKNVVLIHSFKDYCAINFFKGALLKDVSKLLIQPTKNIQAERQLRFTSVQEIIDKKEIIGTYLKEAITIEKSGKKIAYKKVSEFDVPKELEDIFKIDDQFKLAFHKLTKGRQKGYLLFFNQPKQSKTKLERIEKYKQRIFDGKGIRDCVCGLSKRMPNCDGSHKLLNA